MSFYAFWDHTAYAPQVLRQDTRIYWADGNHCQNGGRCVGTFIGENPGAGRAVNSQNGWGLLIGKNGAPGDQTLLAIKSAWTDAVRAGGKTPHADDYIEVLNIYYFRCPTSGVAFSAWTASGAQRLYFPFPRNTSRFAVLGWGKNLNSSAAASSLVSACACPVIVSDLNGAMRVYHPPLKPPMNPYPAQPSALAQRGYQLKFIRNLAAALQPHV